jgi:hypothetical protein
MLIDVSAELKATEAQVSDPEWLRLALGHACVARVSHLLEDSEVVRCLDVLSAYLKGRCDQPALARAAAEAATLANRHQGSHSLDGVGHAAVSASYAVANALSGRANQAADYAAYASIYGGGGYGAVSEPDSFIPEKSWQLARLHELAASLPSTKSAA